jgi:conjugal transfer pilin signal peptidase TrbI
LPRWRTLAALGAAGLAWAALHDWSQRHAFMINASESLPNWAFFVDKGVMPGAGEYAFFRVRETPLIRAHFGEHPQPFGKLVYGVAGDIVTRSGQTVLVNGKPVAVLKTVSKRGEPLVAGPVGRVPPGCYFLATPHKDGFDSRYADIGWVCAAQIVGTGVPVL